ncbi:MAG TPA: LysR family transcriptional regulator [Burkholderiaceae bacterium]|nr:LysR family transcriptional regulator [Burkholderiaceae bacterium]
MLDALTLGQLRTFVAIADAGSFRAAATRLRRAQSAVSHAVAAMERELGVRLFDRTSHRPTLTPEGVALLEDARAVLIKLDAMRGRARGLSRGLELELHLTVDTLFPLPVLGEALRAWRTQMPTVRLILRVEPLGGPLAALKEGRSQLAISVGEGLRAPHIEREALGRLEFVAVVAPAHPLAAQASGGRPLGTPGLADHLQIVQSDPSPLSEGQDFGVLSPQTWRVTGQDTKLALIRAGLGWGRMPLWAVEQDLAQGRLLRLPAQGLGPGGSTVVHAFLAHRTDQALGPAASALRRHLIAASAAMSA